MDDIERVRAALYALLDDAIELGLSRSARLRIVAVIGDLEAAIGTREAPPDDPPQVPRV